MQGQRRGHACLCLRARALCATVMNRGGTVEQVLGWAPMLAPGEKARLAADCLCCQPYAFTPLPRFTLPDGVQCLRRCIPVGRAATPMVLLHATGIG
jgi:hypothetical protein